MKIKRIKQCRLCGSEKLSKLFSLGNLFISTFVNKVGDNIGKAPLELVWCDQCTLVQLRHTAPQELIYSGKYWYESGLNQVIVDDLHDIVNKGLKLVKYEIGDKWLDLGANDGTLLSFVPKKWVRVGFEPAKNLLSKLKKNADTVYSNFWNYEILEKKILAIGHQRMLDEWRPKVVTAIGMFYDMDDPNQFVRDVTKVLHKDGVFIAQLMCAKSMLEKNDVGNICHEHLEYYSYKSLKYLFENNGLEIFKVEENKVNGGSYRLYARHYRRGSVSHRERITRRSYKSFYKRICQNKEYTINFVKKCNQYKEGVYAYGASTKGNTILQWYRLGPKNIRGIAEIHPEKFRKFTVGSNIPILEETEARKDADWFLVLPYAFKEQFINREVEWLKYGGKFMFTTPSFEIYGK